MLLTENDLTINKIIDNLDNKDKQNKTISNLQVICDYYYNLHLLSYLYLKTLNNRYLMGFIFASLTSGLIDLLNYKDNYSEYLYLSCGIINIFLSIFFNTYKNLKIAENLQEHYTFSNKFQILKYKINTQKTLLDLHEEFCIYRNIYLFVKEINDEISTLLLSGPNFPAIIINNYNTNNNNPNNIQFNEQKLNTKSLNLLSPKNILGITNNVIINQNEVNNVETPTQKIKKRKSIFHLDKKNTCKSSYKKNEDCNLDITKINDSDIDNFKKFINVANSKKRERVKISDTVITI